MSYAAGSNENVILEVKGLTKYFGGLAAVHHIDFAVNVGEILGIIGPNGAGKSTIFNLLVGYYQATSGNVIYQGKDITGTRPDNCTKMGIVRMTQANAIFKELTVLENVLMAYHLSANIKFPGELFGLPATRRRVRAIEDKAMELLKTLELDRLYNSYPDKLPHGMQRFLGVAMAMAANPKVLLLDEPTAGLTAHEADLLVEETKKIRDMGVTVLFIEHNVRLIMGNSDRVLVLNFGEKIAEGKPEVIAQDASVIEAYLGAEYVA